MGGGGGVPAWFILPALTGDLILMNDQMTTVEAFALSIEFFAMLGFNIPGPVDIEPAPPSALRTLTSIIQQSPLQLSGITATASQQATSSSSALHQGPSSPHQGP